MKRSLRLFLVLPFVIVTFFYLKFSLSDDGCRDIRDSFYTLLLYFLLAITIPLAFVGIFRRQSKTLKVESVSFIITLLTVACLLFGRLGEGYIKGQKWLVAENEIIGKQESAMLLLRQNNTFVISLVHSDFTCSFSGKYQKNKDTIILERKVIDKADSMLTTKYFLQNKKLIPVIETSAAYKMFDTLYVR